MRKSRLPYKFLMVLLVFSLILIVPFSLVTLHNTDKMVQSMEDVAPLGAEQRMEYEKYQQELTENLISLAFYIFIIAFILSLFFSRKFMGPLAELHRGARAIRDGDLDVEISVGAGDEFQEVLRAFNEMKGSLKKRFTELLRKETYVEMMFDPLWVVDDDNVMVDVNPAFLNLFGYERDEVIGSSIFDFLDDESDRVMREQIRNRDRGEGSSYAGSSYEVSIISRRDGLIPVLISGAPIIEDGEVVGKLGIIKDFRREMALRDAYCGEKDFTETIMQSMSDSMLVIDRDYRVVKANAAALANAGRDIVGELCYRVFHSYSESCYLRGEVCPAKNVFDNGRSFRTVHEHIEGGVKVFQDITAYPVREQHGETKYVVEILKDVTDRKRFDDEIAQKDRELTTINSITKILAQSLRAEDIFNNILDRVIELMDMDGGGIYFVDELGRDLVFKYHRGLSEEFIGTVQRLRVGDDLPGKVALTGQSSIVPDVSRAEVAGKSVFRHSGVKGYACTPIRGKEKMLGVFFVFSFKPHVFSPEDERILNSIGEMMGIALQNVQLYEKMRDLYESHRTRRDEEQKNLLGLSSMLSATLDIKGVLRDGLSLVKNSCRADFVWLLGVGEDGKLSLLATSEEGVEVGMAGYGSDVNTIERTAISRRESVVEVGLDADNGYMFSEGLKDYNTACSIPVYVGDKALGAITLYYKMMMKPREEDIHFVRTVSNILAVALERERLYEDVIIERELASTILDGIADGVMTVDPEGNVISMNRAAEEIVGMLPRSAVGIRRNDVLNYSEENVALQRKMRECFDEALRGEQGEGEADLVDMKGRRLPLMFRSAPVRDNRGDIVGVVYVLRDLGREKELDMLRGEFVKAVSHEFRTPLSTIVGMAEMIIDGEVKGEKVTEYMEAILSEGSRLTDLVTDVLNLQRMESGKEVFREAEVDFKALLLDTKEFFKPVIAKKEIMYSSKPGKAARKFYGDVERLKHLLRSLVDNALTYCDQGTRVEVSFTQRGEKVHLKVMDEGWGIPKDELKHVSEKFYRGSHVLKEKGTGLGLSICGEIVKMHGGRIMLDSEQGRGTTVTVELPIRRKK